MIDTSPPDRPVAGPEADGERRHTFIVEGMCCAEEARQIEAQLRPLRGITRLQFDLVNRRLRVNGTVRSSDIQAAVKAIGMTARPEGQAKVAQTFWQRRGRFVMAAASGCLLAIGLIVDWIGASAAAIALLALSAVTGGWFVAPKGWLAVRRGVLDMNFLMTAATMGAAAIGEWSEAASVMFLFAVAQLLESFSLGRARNAIKALMDISPTEATVRRNGREVTVPVADITIGERIVIRPGQKVPLDGIVREGESSVNQAPITGESIPVDKTPGAEVFAGSINEHGTLEVEATTLVEDTTLARIIHAVEEAQATRAPSQSFVDRFAAVYTPAVVAVAILLVFVPPLLGFGAWSTWFYRALATLVVACPCALVISTPVSIVSGLTGAARLGILIKGGLHLENAGAASTLAFDKTGTLTAGRAAVTDVVPLEDASEADVLRLAAAIEQGSEHPIARAVVAAATMRGLSAPAASAFRATAGRGVEAVVEARRLYLGNPRFVRERGLLSSHHEEIVQRLEGDGKTVVVLSGDTGAIGVLGIGDEIRPHAAEAIQALRRAGIRRILMLTGDNEGAARVVAARLGITEYHAELLPDEKAKVVRGLEATGERVVFVGDGVNDAPAIATATVGVAMGAAGTDVALETADIALMSDDLSKLPVALHASRKTLGIIKQNIAFSLAIKAVFIVLAIGGWATLWMAVASDMGASLVVILNGLRALRPVDSAAAVERSGNR